jgi:hypothetical protein
MIRRVELWTGFDQKPHFEEVFIDLAPALANIIRMPSGRFAEMIPNDRSQAGLCLHSG